MVTLLVLGGLVAGVVGFIMYRSAQDEKVASALEELVDELGCEMQIIDSNTSSGNTANHVDGPIDYPRLPPESGDHRSNWIVKSGIYTETLPVENTTHNLEHGQVLFHYAPTVSDAVVAELQQAVLVEPLWTFSIPYDDFNQGQVLSLTAWEVRVDCPKTRPDQAEKFGEMARAFVDVYRDARTYEHIPADSFVDQRNEDEEE